MIYDEHDEQVAVVRWCEVHKAKYPQLWLLYATPNGRKCTPRQGAWLNQEGRKKGVPDLCLPVPSSNNSALYIEMKSKKGKLTPDQFDWKDMLEKAGNKVVVHNTWIDAIDEIINYLQLPEKIK